MRMKLISVQGRSIGIIVNLILPMLNWMPRKIGWRKCKGSCCWMCLIRKIHARYRYRWGDIRYRPNSGGGAAAHAVTPIQVWQKFLALLFSLWVLGLSQSAKLGQAHPKTESTENFTSIIVGMARYWSWVLAQVQGFSLSLIGSYSPNQGYMEADFTKLKFSNGAVRNYGKPRMHFIVAMKRRWAQIKKLSMTPGTGCLSPILASVISQRVKPFRY